MAETPYSVRARAVIREHIRYVVDLKHADKASSGHPDSSFTRYDHTLWTEFKHANPDFASQGIQELTCKRLEQHGRCIYVIFDTLRDCITILSPKDIGKWSPKTASKDVPFGLSCIGFDYDWLAAEIEKRLR